MLIKIMDQRQSVYNEICFLLHENVSSPNNKECIYLLVDFLKSKSELVLIKKQINKNSFIKGRYGGKIIGKDMRGI